HDGAHDDGVLPSSPRVVPVHRVPEAQAGRAGLRRHPGILREAQLARGLAGDGDGPAAPDLRRGRRLRDAAAVLLRLRRQSEGLAPFDGVASTRGDAEVQEPRAEVSAVVRVGPRTEEVLRPLSLTRLLPGSAAPT